MDTLTHRTITRRTFLFGAGAGALLAANPIAAAASPDYVNVRNHGVKGDGSDETDAIQAVLDDYRNVYFPPAPVAYSFDGAEGFTLRSGHTLRGSGNQGKLLRLPSGDRVNMGFRNPRGQSIRNVHLHNLYIAGRGREDNDARWDKTFEESGERTVGAAIRLATLDEDLCTDITLTDMTVVQWPGQALKCYGGRNYILRRTRAHDCARGGLVFIGKFRGAELRGCRVTKNGDDEIAFTAGEGNRRGDAEFAHDVQIIRCSGYTRRSKIAEGGGNAGIALRGVREGLVWGCNSGRAQKDSVMIMPHRGYDPANIRVAQCDLRNPGRSGIGVYGDVARGIKLLGNTVKNAPHAVGWDVERKTRCQDRGNRVVD